MPASDEKHTYSGICLNDRQRPLIAISTIDRHYEESVIQDATLALCRSADSVSDHAVLGNEMRVVI